MNTRIVMIGNIGVSYDLEGKITQIGIEDVKYDSQERMAKVGQKTVYYETVNNITRIHRIGKEPAIYDENGLLIKLGDRNVSYGSNEAIPRSKPIPIPDAVLTHRSSNYDPSFLSHPVKTTEPPLKERAEQQLTFKKNTSL